MLNNIKLLLKSVLFGIHLGAMASASASVDSKAELTALLEQWERERLANTQELDNILTKSVFLLLLHQHNDTLTISLKYIGIPLKVL